MRKSLSLGAAIVMAACASGGGPAPGAPGEPVGASGRAAVLPPIPDVRGPLRPYVEYPDSLQPIAVRDSNFLFGTVGSGDATLLINGQFVPVQPNGAFLAWLPVPEAEAGDTAYYRIRVRRGQETRTYAHPILLWRPFEGEGAVWLDSAGYREPLERWALPDEMLEFRARAAPGLQVQLDATAARYVFHEGPEAGDYRVEVRASSLRRAACDERCGSVGALDSLVLRLVAARGVEGGAADSADIRFALPLRLLSEEALPVVELFEPVDSINGTNGIIVGRPLPAGTFHWRFPAGTRAPVDGRVGERLRLRLSPGLVSWVRAEDARFLPEDTPRPRATVGTLRFQIQPDRIALGIPLAAALPLRVSEPAPDLLVLTLYGAIGNTERISYGRTDPLLRAIDWVQQPGERFELHVRLAEPVWGYRVAYDTTSSGPAILTLEIRRPPAIDPRRPLAGRRIAVDPGHPGAGAYGPTGYYEGDANLGIARQLADLLRAEGAEPILIRDDTLPMGLYERTARAIDEDAEIFVSIHNNALPDGVRPYGREGTSTYYFHPHSRDLAASIQAGMLRRMGLRDLGYFWGDLAVARMSWMPSALTEGAFMMMPDHEEALKTPEFQRAYAAGVLDGLRAFLSWRAPRRR